ncbi:hypothetical protein FYK55_03950 [Roseiconus nitratireducens]|uniref:Uncharacterized protein n=1 Tax=Roseiconus nitratireducens TaxID=2605748 RepID=A0A5M6DET6_9BACT|nr:hypothetical protein [Roseiconus nitratireducens]KAA5546064.1 hypothetical protein FYK55_03950 [Roseiconus nitratireducens]
MSIEFTTCQYAVDALDRLVWVDRWWLAFAKENDAGGLAESTVVGRPLWEFISDPATRDVYKEIHRYVRTAGLALVVPFRCDSPSMERRISLTVSSDGSGHVLYESILVRARRHRVSLLDPRLPRSQSELRMCSFCKRVQTDAGRWIEFDELDEQFPEAASPPFPQLTYRVCEDCFAEMRTVCGGYVGLASDRDSR